MSNTSGLVIMRDNNARRNERKAKNSIKSMARIKSSLSKVNVNSSDAMSVEILVRLIIRYQIASLRFLVNSNATSPRTVCNRLGVSMQTLNQYLNGEVPMALSKTENVLELFELIAENNRRHEILSDVDDPIGYLKGLIDGMEK